MGDIYIKIENHWPNWPKKERKREKIQINKTRNEKGGGINDTSELKRVFMNYYQ